MVPPATGRTVHPRRPEPVPDRRARWPPRPARPVVRGRPRARHDDAADVPPGRAVPDALRRGLPRPHSDGVPPGVALRRVARDLRMDPPAPREVRDGARAGALGRGRRQGHEQPRGAGGGRGRRTAPARPRRPRRSRRRAASRRDRHGDPDLRPADAGADLDDPGPGRLGPGARRVGAPAGRRLRGRAGRDARPVRDRSRRCGGRGGAGRPGHRGRAREPPVRHSRWRQRRGRPGRPPRCRRGRDRDDRGGRRGPARPGRAGRRRQRRRDRRHGRRCAGSIRGRVGAGRPAGRQRLGLRGVAGEPRPDGGDGLTRQQGHPRQGRSRHRRRAARGDGRPGRATDRRRGLGGRDLRRPGERHDDLDGRPGGRRARAGLHVGRRRPEAVRHIGRRREAHVSHHRHRRRQRRSRADRLRVASAAGSRRGRRLRPRKPDGPHPRARPDDQRHVRAAAGRRHGAGMDGLRGRAARERGLRRRPARRGLRRRAARRELRPRRMGRRRQRRLPGDRPPGAAGLRRLRVDEVDLDGVARLRLAAPRRDRRGHHRRAHLPAAADPVPAPARRGAGGALRPRRRDVLRPVADRHERRLRRPVHRGRLHAVRRALDRLVAGEVGVLGGDAGHRRPARPRLGEQMGGALRHRRPCPADPRAERARPRRGHPRADRAHLRPRLHGDHRAGRQRHREPHVPAGDAGAYPHRGRGRGVAPGRLDR